MNKAFYAESGRSIREPPRLLKTPPYVTAMPVVTHRKMELPTEGPEPSPRSALRFMVLATDGLWDELSSEEVVALVGGHLAGLKGNVSKPSLLGLVPTVPGSRGVNGKEQHPQAQQGTWAFVEGDDVATHLIRNAFGGGDEQLLRKRLSIPAPYSRRFRDDVTVTVIWWEDKKVTARSRL